MNEIFFGLSRTKSTMRPTCWLLTPLMIVLTGTMSTPAACRFSMARSFTSKRFGDVPMLVGGVPHAVELQVDVTQPGPGRLAAEFGILGELDAVRGRLYALEAQLRRVRDGPQEVLRERRLAAAELDRHLAVRLLLGRAVQDGLDLVPLELVDETDLVRVGEARVAHHVAAVRQIDVQDRAAAVAQRAVPVVVHAVGVVDGNVRAGAERLHPPEERRIRREHLFVVPVLRAVLHHQDLAVALDDPRRDLAGVVLDEEVGRGPVVGDQLARLARARGAQRRRLSRHAEGRTELLLRLEQRVVGPCGSEGAVRGNPIERLNEVPEPVRHPGKALLYELGRCVHGSLPRGRCRRGVRHHAPAPVR